MRPVDADNLYEKACDLEAQALSYVGKIGNDESKIEEWKIWSAILTERTAFKHDVYDAPTIEPERTGKWVEQDDGWDGVYYECSICKEPFTLIDGTPSDNLYNYCPNCGARMEETT